MKIGGVFNWLLVIVLFVALAYFILTRKPPVYQVQGEAEIKRQKAKIDSLLVQRQRLDSLNGQLRDSIRLISARLNEQEKNVLALRHREKLFKSKINAFSDHQLDSVLRIYFPVPDSVLFRR